MIDTPQEVLTDTEGEIPVTVLPIPPRRDNYHTPSCWSFYQIMASVDEPATVRCVCQRRLYTYEDYFYPDGTVAVPTMVGDTPLPSLPSSPGFALEEPLEEMDEEGEEGYWDDLSFLFGPIICKDAEPVL